MQPGLEFIGEGTLPKGWQRPTRQLVEKEALYQRVGLAPTHAPHLSQRAQHLADSKLKRVEKYVKLLEDLVNPNSYPEVKSVGMAYPQLTAASQGSFRVFVADIGMRDLHPDSRRGGTLFINPVVTPIQEAGTNESIEMCFSCPGVATLVRRWNVVTISNNGGDPIRLKGTPARIIQHEHDHLEGELCINRGLRQGNSLLYLPPELHRSFFDEFVKRNHPSEWPLRFPEEQWRAMERGQYSPRYYVDLL